MTDPLSAAIEIAVARALDARLPALLNAIKLATPAPLPAPVEAEDRFIKFAEACRLLKMHRTTIIRHEKAGKIPKRRRQPGGGTGYTLTDIRQILGAMSASSEVSP